MKKIAFLLFAAILFGCAIVLNAQKFEYSDNWSAEGFNLTESGSSRVAVDFSIRSFTLEPVVLHGETMSELILPGSFLFNDEGCPNLPGNGRMIAIPRGAAPKLRIVSSRSETIHGVSLVPAPRIPKENEDGPLFQEKNMAIYSANAFYPAEPVKISEPGKLRGVDYVTLGITPFQYNPVTKELRVLRDIRVEISFEGGNGTFGEERLRSRFWDPILEDAFLNYQSLPTVDYNARLQQVADDPGCEYLIITPNGASFTQWADTIRRFRIQQGITTLVKTLAQVGGNTTTAIEAYINNAYNTWNPAPAAVLLLGDFGTDANSSVISPIYNAYCVSDNIYGDIDGNHLPDISMARITANNATQLQVMISKFLNYERNPPISANFYAHPISALGWQTERWFQICSEAVGGYWKYNQLKDPVRINEIYSGTPGSVWSTATNTNTVVNYFGPNGQNYIPAQPSSMACCWTGGNATQINSAINSGAFCLLHRDHGMETGWGEPSYTNTNINGLTNVNNQLPFIFSINCLTGKYNYGSESFAEKFHRYTYNNQNSGALALIAASEVSYSFVNDTYLWGMMDNFWPDFMPTYGTTPASRGFLPCFGNSAGKIYLSQSSWPYNTNNKEVTYNLFHHHGDAFSVVYSAVPQTLTVNHNGTINAGTTIFQVTANAGSLIALSLDDQLLGTATGTGAPTDITIPGTLVNGQTMRVTVTLQNYFRYNANVPVVPNGGPQPNFMADTTQLCAGLNVDYTDLSVGNPIAWAWTFPGGTPSSSTEQNPQNIFYNTPGTYNVTLVATNTISSNTITKTAYITVNTPATIANAPAGDTLLCQNNANTIYSVAAIPGQVTYQWELIPTSAGVITPQDNQCIVDWTDTWSGFATLHVQAANGCGTSPFSPPTTIHLRPLPETPTTPTGDTQHCQGQVFLTDYYTTPSANATGYQWLIEPSAAGTISGISTTGTVTWNQSFSGTANISVKAMNNCMESPFSSPLQVTITAVPTVDLGADTTVAKDKTVSLDAGNPGATYLWNNGAMTQVIEVGYTGNATDIYSVVVNINDCEGVDSVRVTFTDPVGLNEFPGNPGINVRPNPGSGLFTVELTGRDGQSVDLQVTNALGTLLFSEKRTLDEGFSRGSIDLRSYPAGVYLLRLSSGSYSQVVKLVITK